MKYHFLGTCCVLLAIMGLTNPARADDVSPTIAANQATRSIESDRVPASNHQSTLAPTPGMSSIEVATYDLVNKYRQFKNLPPLTIEPAISAQAKAHSDEMARSGRMNHDGFDQRANAVSQTIVYRKVAENVAYNMGQAQPDMVAVQGWIESPGHRRNMIGPYDLTGIGISKNARGEYFFTQIFVRKAWYTKDAD